MGSLNNFLAAWKGSGSLGKALKLQRKGEEEKALFMTHRGLSALSSPGVNRDTPHTSSVLIQLTVLCEELAYKHKTDGASTKDLEDTYINISRIYGESGHKYGDFIQYIKKKLGYAPKE